jgi:hypothetical protein
MNIFKPRSRWILAGIILLVGGIVFEEKHRAATLHRHPIAPPRLAYSLPDENAESAATNKNFSDSVSLWFNPDREIHDDDMAYASVLFQSALGNEPVVRDWTEHPDPDAKIHPSSLTVDGKTINYSIFHAGNFTATLNLTPVLPNQQAIIPTEVKPGLGGSFSF